MMNNTITMTETGLVNTTRNVVEFDAISDPTSKGFQIAYDAVCLVVAVVCNTLVIFLVCKTESLHKPRHYLRCHLAAVEIVFATILIPFNIETVVNGPHTIPFACELLYVIGNLSGIAIFGTYFLMAIDMYYFICHPLRYNTQVSVRKVALGMLVVDVLAISIGITPVAIAGEMKSSGSLQCAPEAIDSVQASAVIRNLGIVFQIIFVLIIFILYYLVFKEARQQQERDANQHLRIYQTRAFKTMGGHVIILLVFLSATIFLIVSRRAVLVHEGNPSDAQLIAHKVAVHLFRTLSPMADPLVHSLRVPDFRRALKRLFQRSHRVDVATSSSYQATGVAFVHAKPTSSFVDKDSQVEINSRLDEEKDAVTGNPVVCMSFSEDSD
ncbi:olfactory receptor 2T35-like [Branchiostoma floridae]|uniref:Olfactory receptor 2T35-like n=1 Tax=Branchiostoma floridae TaxID=7739 RepID=A0A9J7HF07_BRAFL|nr:olfactory receptor 2T35-like [Branchiostoma floridae]